LDVAHFTELRKTCFSSSLVVELPLFVVGKFYTFVASTTWITANAATLVIISFLTFWPFVMGVRAIWELAETLEITMKHFDVLAICYGSMSHLKINRNPGEHTEKFGRFGHFLRRPLLR